MLANLLVVAAAMASFQAVAADAVGSWTADLASAKQSLNADKYDVSEATRCAGIPG